MTFDVPIGSAKTIQVTETFFESDISDTGIGPFHQTDKVTLYLQPPALPTENDWHYRLEWEGSKPPKTEGHYVVNGRKEDFYQGKKRASFPSSPGQWNTVFMEMLVRVNEYSQQHHAETVSAFPAVRAGRHMLVAVDTPLLKQPPHLRFLSEVWYDPQTHLPIRRTMSETSAGKTTELQRVEYSNWVLNRPMPQALFDTTKSSAETTDERDVTPQSSKADFPTCSSQPRTSVWGR